ncbi:MAG: sulfatase-like hydrolase/transferase, partial [Actinomycetia bacterium]|nr:sulfatase-like hydrolase/transferase [Actinomycetes bacterium]
LGTIDNHKPWIGRERWLRRYEPEPYHGIHERAAWPKNLGMTPGSMKCNEVPQPRDLRRINAIYDSDISYQDAELGRLIKQLDEWGIGNETMVIITADHGEELWEHGICGHGASLREPLVWVPLLIHYPPLFPGGRVVSEGVEGVDILPTIIDAIGRSPLDGAQGHSLIPLAQGQIGGYPMPSYASQYEYAHAMRLG